MSGRKGKVNGSSYRLRLVCLDMEHLRQRECQKTILDNLDNLDNLCDMLTLFCTVLIVSLTIFAKMAWICRVSDTSLEDKRRSIALLDDLFAIH